MVGFIFGSKDKDKPWSYEELQRKREIAQMLMASQGTPKNVGEGLTAIGKALAARGIDKKASAEEARLRDEFNAKWATAFGGGGAGVAARGGGGYGGGSPSGTWTPDAPPPSPVDVATTGMDVAKSGGLTFGADKPKADPGVMGAQGGLDFGAAVMTPQEMLIEGAKARGLDPIDVATAISYETGGKFDPMISGPTTQWGTHRGLIQFGEPQAKQHGVDFSDPDAAWRSQLNPESGAVWDYLDSTGVKPGMGLPEIYSAINAGAVGRMGASDANNGGAPGTVADKVASMGPHREKAAQFLGGTWTPDPNAPQGGSQGMAFADAGGGFGGGFDIGSLVGLASDPMASPAQKAIVETLIQQQLQAADPLRAIQLERERLELEALKNPQSKQPETLTERQALLEAAGIDPNSPEGQNYLLTGQLPEPPKTETPTDDMREYELAKSQGYTGTFQEYMTEMKKAGAANTTVNNMIGDEPPAGDALRASITDADTMLGMIRNIGENPALSKVTGSIEGGGGNNVDEMNVIQRGWYGDDGLALIQEIGQLQGNAWLGARALLKGGGQITDYESKKAEGAMARLSRAQGTAEFKAALKDLEDALVSGLEKLKANEKAPQGGNDLGLSEDDLKYLEQP